MLLLQYIVIKCFTFVLYCFTIYESFYYYYYYIYYLIIIIIYSTLLKLDFVTK